MSLETAVVGATVVTVVEVVSKIDVTGAGIESKAEGKAVALLVYVDVGISRSIS